MSKYKKTKPMKIEKENLRLIKSIKSGVGEAISLTRNPEAIQEKKDIFDYIIILEILHVTKDIKGNKLHKEISQKYVITLYVKGQCVLIYITTPKN